MFTFVRSIDDGHETLRDGVKGGRASSVMGVRLGVSDTVVEAASMSAGALTTDAAVRTMDRLSSKPCLRLSKPAAMLISLSTPDEQHSIGVGWRAVVSPQLAIGK